MKYLLTSSHPQMSVPVISLTVHSVMYIVMAIKYIWPYSLKRKISFVQVEKNIYIWIYLLKKIMTFYLKRSLVELWAYANLIFSILNQVYRNQWYVSSSLQAQPYCYHRLLQQLTWFVFNQESKNHATKNKAILH